MSMFRLAGRVRGTRVPVALAVAISLSIAACGDDEETTTTSAAGVSGATGATGAESSTSDESLGALEDALRENLTGAQGLSEAQADCAIDEIFDEVSPEEIQQAAQTGDIPKGLFESAFDAGVKCAQ